MKKTLLLLAFGLLTSCCQPKVKGHYVYQHGWNYDIQEGNIDVHETGTMDFYDNGCALDSARQVYKVTFNDGGKATWIFNYVSPSKWHVEGEDFYFSGIEESFRMELMENVTENCDKEKSAALAQKIINNVSRGISRETKFHLAELSKEKLMWRYSYSNGNTDTWTFYRQEK
ncbi:MAG: hypothetical protein J6R17_02845 [Bacteroidales bacterium]|nr:hypothetical protein [Bacteroidales bacterium]